MNIGDSALTAFTTVAGIAPDKLSLLIRTLLLAFTFLWAAWCVYGEIHCFKHHDVDAIDMIRKFTRILLITTLMVVLVFI